MRQLALDLVTQPPRYGREDFLPSPCNLPALAVIDAFMEAREPALAIAGPAASGKTHLAHILAARAGAGVLSERPVEVAGEIAGPLIVCDNADASGDPAALLILVETCRERGVKLALAGRGEPRDWARGLKDLETRLSAMARAVLQEPDEALLRAVILKGFEDRNLHVQAAVVDYAAPRMPGTFAAARAFVALCEREILESPGKISVSLARKVLGNLSEAVSPS